MQRKPWLWLITGLILLSILLLSPAWAATTAPTPTGARDQPYSIQLLIDGRVIPGITAVSGIESSVEPVDEQTTSGLKKRPGKTKFANITLKRSAVGADAALLEWYRKVLNGSTERKSGSIIYLDREGKELMRYNFFEAWPCRWKAPELNANSDANLIEEIEFVVEKVERA